MINDIKYKKVFFEYCLSFKYSCTCDYCKNKNIYKQDIIKTKEELLSDKNIEELELKEDRKKEVMTSLKESAIKDFNRILSLSKENNYSYLKYNKCQKCNKTAKYNFKNYMHTKLFVSFILYLIITIVFLILNIILKNVMLSFFNYKDSFFTSIFFFPTVSLLISSVFYLNDVIRLNKEKKAILNGNISYPLIDNNWMQQENISINEK